MVRKTDFSAEKAYKIGSLTYEETRKHAADKESGVSLQWILHILSECKKVDIVLHKKTIMGSLSKAVREKKLFFVKGCYQLPNQREKFAERQAKLERIRKERERLRQKEALASTSFEPSKIKKKLVEGPANKAEIRKKRKKEMRKKKKEEMKKKKKEEMKKKKKEEMKHKRRTESMVVAPKQHAYKKDSNVLRYKKTKN